MAWWHYGILVAYRWTEDTKATKESFPESESTARRSRPVSCQHREQIQGAWYRVYHGSWKMKVETGEEGMTRTAERQLVYYHHIQSSAALPRCLVAHAGRVPMVALLRLPLVGHAAECTMRIQGSSTSCASGGRDRRAGLRGPPTSCAS